MLHKIVEVRHENRPDRNWVSISTKTLGERILITICVWNHRGVSHAMLAFGTNTPHQDECLSRFED